MISTKVATESNRSLYWLYVATFGVNWLKPGTQSLFLFVCGTPSKFSKPFATSVLLSGSKICPISLDKWLEAKKCITQMPGSARMIPVMHLFFFGHIGFISSTDRLPKYAVFVSRTKE